MTLPIPFVTLRSVVLTLAAVSVLTVLLSLEGWDPSWGLLGAIGLAHVAAGTLLTLRQPRDSPVHWLALGLVLLGTRFATGLITPELASLGTGRFSVPEALSSIAAGSLLQFARHYGSRGAPRCPRPRLLAPVDRQSVSFGIGIAAFYLWSPAALDKELLHVPWELYSVIRTMQYAAQYFAAADTAGRVRLRWFFVACTIWLVALLPILLQVAGLPGRIALSVAGFIVFIGSTVLAVGILTRGEPVSPDLPSADV